MYNLFSLSILSLLLVTLTTESQGSEDWQFAGASQTNTNPFVASQSLLSYKGATLAKQGEWISQLDLSISNEFIQQSSATEQASVDIERTQLALGLKYGLSDKLEIGLELPYIYYGGGIFDQMIENWHDLLNLKNGGRELMPTGQVNIQYVSSEQRFNLDQSGGGLGDIRLFFGKAIIANDHIKLNYRGQLTLPTGNEDELRGNGGYGLSIGFDGAYQFNSKWSAYAAIAGNYLLDRKLLVTDNGSADNQLVVSSTLGGQYHIKSDWTLQGQLFYSSKVYESELDLIKGQGGVLNLSVIYEIDPSQQINIGFSEDVMTKGAVPDFAVQLSWQKHF